MRSRFLVLVCAVLLASCDDARVYEELRHIEEKEGWKQDQKLDFETEISDTNQAYNLHLDLRIDDNYPYSNLYILFYHSDTMGHQHKEMKHFVLADDKGKWLGSGLGDIHSYRLPLYQNYRFHSTGKHRFSIAQNMRLDVLGGVKDVGLRVEKAQ